MLQRMATRPGSFTAGRTFFLGEAYRLGGAVSSLLQMRNAFPIVIVPGKQTVL